MQIGVLEVTENGHELRIKNRLRGESGPALLIAMGGCVFLSSCGVVDIKAHNGVEPGLPDMVFLIVGLVLLVRGLAWHFSLYRTLLLASRGPDGLRVLGKPVGENAVLRIAPRFGAFAVMLDSDGVRPVVLYSFRWRRDAEDLAALVARFLGLRHDEV
jgi:hypothetical protein